MNGQENKLGVMPIGRLLLVMSIPMMISFFIQALYNIVDSMFVARISEDALTAVSIAYPVQQVITAIGVGTGVGVNALVPRYMGQGNPEQAKRIANIAVFLSFCYTVIFMVIGQTLIHSYYVLQTDVESIVTAGTQYLSIVCTVCVGAFFGQNFEKLLVATGNTFCSMAAQASGAIFNLIFDPLLIFGIGPFPQLGVRGAAIATVGGQIFAAAVAICLLMKKEKTIRLSIRHMQPTLHAIKDIYSIGIPSMLTVGLGSVMSFCINQILLGFSTTATAVFGIWMKLQSFSFMPVFGLNNGTVPMIAYNYGAGHTDRVKQTIALAMKVAVGLMLALVAVYECIPGLLLAMFSASDLMLSIGTVALRICCLSLPFGAVCVIISSSLQSLGRGGKALLINLLRQLVILVPAAWLLSLSGNLSLVWLATPIAEVLSMIAAIFLRREIGKILEYR